MSATTTRISEMIEQEIIHLGSGGAGHKPQSPHYRALGDPTAQGGL